MSDESETLPAAPAGTSPRITIVAGGVTQTRELPPGQHVTLGRSRSAQITIDDGSLSREHGRLEFGDQLLFVDLGSSNGSWVGGRKAEPHVRVPVGEGELIELGQVIVIVQGTALANRSQPGPSPSRMEAVQAAVMRAASHDLSVLVLGETGVGKGVMAREIHAASGRATGPFVVVDCASLARNVVESELFGHERGAFTGAQTAKQGLLEAANGGTAFLDELGELELPLQAKLLRVIEERKVRRVGDVRDRDIDVRFIAATNRDVESDAAAGLFRTDLLYRLNAVTLRIPPLRERAEQIVPLARKFLADVGPGVRLGADAEQWLRSQAWPGNVRELRNAVERAYAGADAAIIGAAAFKAFAPHSADASGGASKTGLAAPEQQTERDRILAALEACAGNQTKAAAKLGISRRTLVHRLDLYGLPRPRKRTD